MAVREELRDHLPTVTLDRPEAFNALTQPMMRRLARILDNAAGDAQAHRGDGPWRWSARDWGLPKRNIVIAETQDFSTALDLESANMVRSSLSEDAAEARSAFAEKRAPRFFVR